MAESKKEASKPKKEKETIKNNSAFKRAMVQIGIKPGEKVYIVYDDGSRYEVTAL